MKKKVLFALIALFSFVGAWADANVTVKDVTVTLSSSYVVGTTPPTMTVVTEGWTKADGVYEYDATNFKYEALEGTIPGAGTYFLKVTKGDEARYIPFQVGVESDSYDVIKDETSFNTSSANGALSVYYAKYPWCDLWNASTHNVYDPSPEAWFDGKTQAERLAWWTANGAAKLEADNLERSWASANAAPKGGEGYTIVAPYGFESPVRPVFVYEFESEPVAQDLAGEVAVMPWGIRSIQAFGLASLPYEFGWQGFAIGSWQTSTINGTPTYTTENTDNAFDENKFTLIALPDLAAFPVSSSVEYNGIGTQGPGVVVAGLPEGYTLGLTVKNSLTKAVGITGVGSYYYEVAIINQGETLTVRTIDSAPFKVTGKKLNVNIAQLTKTYGQDDPIYAKVERDASTPMGEGEDFDNIRKAFLFERESNEGADAEKVGPHKYIVHIDPAFPLNYDVSILQNYGYLYIDQAPMTVYVANNSKVYGEADPDFKEDKSITDKFSIKDAENNDKTADLKDDLTITRKEGSTPNTYAFKGTSASGNYAYYFDPADFTITAKDAEGLTVTASDFTYNGYVQEPSISTGKLTVKDNGNDVDPNLFEVSYSGERKNVTPANATDDQKPTVTVTFKENNGLYTGSISQTYKILPADLIITPDNMVKETGYVFNAAEVTYEYTGLQNNEAAADAITNLNTITTSAVATDDAKVFKLQVNLGEATAQNYTLKTAEGVLSIGRAILAVKATAAEKEYGEDDPDFEFTASVQANNADPVNLTAAQADEILKLGGKYVFTLDRKSDSEDAGVYENDLDFDGPKTLMDYTIQYVPANFTITKAPLYISAAGVNIEVNYGEDLPNYTTPGSYTYSTGVTVIGLKRTDTDAILMGTRPNTTTPCLIYALDVQKRNADETTTYIPYNVTPDAGVYEVYPKARSWYTGNRVLKNYDVIFLPQAELPANASNDLKAANKYGKLTVNPIALTATPQNNEKYYGLADPTLTATVTNAAGQTVANNIFNLTNYFQVVREPGENAGNYTISIVRKLKENAANNADFVDLPNNYSVTYTATGTFTIKKAVIKVVAKDQAIQYAEAINGYDYDATIVEDEDGNDMGKLVALDADGKLTETRLTNEQIGHLTTDVTKVGANKNAYEFVVDNANIDAANVDFKNAWLTIYPLKTIPLGAADLAKITKNSLKQVLFDHQGYEVDVVLPTDHAPMRANEWYSFVLPFDVRVRTLSTTLGWCAPNILDTEKSAGKNIHFKLETLEIPANTPFIVKVDEPILSTALAASWTDPNFDMDKASGDLLDFADGITFEGVTIAPFEYKTKKPGEGEGVQFVGTYEAMRIYNANEWFLNFKSGSSDPRKFYYANSTNGSPIKETEAYAVTTVAGSEANVRFFIQEPDGTITAIDGVDAGEEVAYGEGWYTINGIKLDAEPTTSGTYIFNGKKVYIQK